MVTMRDCKGCGKQFSPIANQQYCGRPCVSPTQERLQAKWPQVKACEGCGEPYTAVGPQHRFCKGDCNPRNTPKPKRKEAARFCTSCGGRWIPSHPRVQTPLCAECRESHRADRVFIERKGWRDAVRAKAGNLCEECGATEKDTGHHHHAHHIVPRAEGGQNTLANGKLLCVNCHKDTHGGATGGTPLGALTPEVVDQIAEAVVKRLREGALA